jgi:hypothetical protein
MGPELKTCIVGFECRLEWRRNRPAKHWKILKAPGPLDTVSLL